VEFPPDRPGVWVDESRRMRRLEVLQEVNPDGALQVMIKTGRYFENLHGERQLEHDLVVYDPRQ
jgi:hypothetical protein